MLKKGQALRRNELMEFRTLKDGRVIPISNPLTHNLATTAYSLLSRPQNFKGYKTIQSFTSPNYECKNCGRKVFYYEHPNGAKVLFDSLGPPWPKHPCYVSAVITSTNKSAKKSKQKSNRWLPAFFERAITLKSGGMRIQIQLNKHQLRFELTHQQVLALGVNQNSIRDALIQVEPSSLSSRVTEVSIHTGKQPVTTRAQKVESQDTSEPIVATEQTPLTVESSGTKTVLKPTKSASKPDIKVINPRLIITDISLTMKADNYFLITGTCMGKPMVLGATLALQQNQTVLNLLIKNPKTIELLPVKKEEKFFHLLHKNSKLGRLEQDPDLLRTALNKQITPAKEDPFRNSVLSASALLDLKAQIKKQEKLAMKKDRITPAHKPYT